MKQSYKYALDQLFLFMLFVSAALIAIDRISDVNISVFHTIEIIDFTIVGGYYIYFFQGLSKSAHKIQYCKKHVFLIVLLLLPIFPLARMLRLPLLEKIFKVSADVTWHLLDEVGML